MLLHDDGTSDGEALPRTLADFLRREERVEDPFQILLRYTAAIVLEHDLHESPGRRRSDPDASRAHVASGGLDGVGGIDDEVQEDLIELAHVAHDERQLPELGLHFRAVLVLIARDEQSRFDRAI